MPPRMITGERIAQNASLKLALTFFQLNASPLPVNPFLRHTVTAVMIKRVPSTMPGKNPPINIVAIDAFTDIPYDTMGILGGMITPRHPAAATRAIANFLS